MSRAVIAKVLISMEREVRISRNRASSCRATGSDFSELLNFHKSRLLVAVCAWSFSGINHIAVSLALHDSC